MRALAASAFVYTALVACGPPSVVHPESAPALSAASRVAMDTAPKEDLRLVPPEVYMRSYLQWFGGLAPADVQKRAKGADGNQLFDTWDDYLSAMGFPDYRNDLPRAQQTNAIMVATFERLAIALCDRAVEHDLKSLPVTPMAERAVFAFENQEPMTEAAFAPRFDVLHRTFLGYPATLAPGPVSRSHIYYGLFSEVVTARQKSKAKARFTPTEAAWAAVCYGLARHPETHLY